MLILDNLQSIRDGIIDIPMYQRGPLSLNSGTALNLACISKLENKSTVTEIVGSIIQFKDWDRLIRISAKFNDEKGIYSKLTSILKHHKITVINGESSTIKNRELHSIEIIARVDFEFQNEIDFNLLNTIEQKIIPYFSNDELPVRGDYPRIRVRKVKGLFNAKKEYFKRIDENDKHPLKTSVQIKSGSLNFPIEFISLLNESAKIQIVTDTKERLIRIFVPPKDEEYSFIRLKFKNSPKFFSLITNELKQHFNILMSYIRPVDSIYYTFEALLDPNPSNKVSKIENLIDDLFSHQIYANADIQYCTPVSVNQTDVEYKRPSVEFDSTNDKSDNKKHDINSNDSPKSVDDKRNILNKDFDEIHDSTVNLYDKQISNLNKQIKDSENDIDKEIRLRKRINILKIIKEKYTNYSSGNPKYLFMSYSFKESTILSSVKHCLKNEDSKSEIEVKDGSHGNNHERYRDAIIERIKECDVFLGVWTNDGTNKVSAWLLWELGVAMAFKKPCRIMIENNLNQDQLLKILPEINHENFSFGDFEDKMKMVLGALTSDYKKNTTLYKRQ